MQKTIDLAREAAKIGEVPVAAILVDNTTKKIICHAINLVEQNKNPTHHAELLCINKAFEIVNSKSLAHTSIFINLQPCQMCYSAICISKIKNIYFSATNSKGYLVHPIGLYKPEIYSGILEEESEKLIKQFFTTLR